MKYEQIYNWKMVRNLINKTIVSHFAYKEITTENDDRKVEEWLLKDEMADTFAFAEESISRQIMLDVPCLKKYYLELMSVWVAFFDFKFINFANEKTDNAYSQITINYNKATEWLQENKDKFVCKESASDTTIADLMKFNYNKKPKVF